ncbi:protein kinase domain-containing protein [Nocardioides nitrophenolicus]|uniref:protein kinase domain-containing protein n=1 Tax=Nocardioides nitrophenolicus TaxID=60489 RepID=UPI00195C8BA9|nr:protein kinase [Nocardioides nitrophenolicus]MBM7518924.1 serine/threonine protein kinase [Nocardioides nitrophenolicus]
MFGVVAERYELLEIVGSGGMGVVYRARDRVLGRTVAVKVIRQELADEEFVRRFEREAAILARVRSPHIVVVFDYGSSADRFYLVTDFHADGDLVGWLERNGPMPPRLAVEVAAAVAEGLADAHAAGVVHRDVKPGNVLLWRRGERLLPVLADFGIATADDGGLTVTGGVPGSPPFMAPERHLGQAATAATDIYALGCLLYNLLTGRPPYDGTSFQAASAHINDPVPALPDGLERVAGLDEIVARCMAKAPEDRYPTATAAAEALRAWLAAGTPPTAPTTVTTPPSPPPPASLPRRRLVPALLAIVLVVAAVGAGAWWLLGRDEPSTARPRDPGTTSPPPAVPALDLSVVPGEACRYPKTVDGTTHVVDCSWFDVRATGLAPETPVEVEVRLAIDGTYAKGVARLEDLTSPAGVLDAGQHVAPTDYDGLCPDRRCPGGFPLADDATQARVTVRDADRVLVEREFLLAELRSS